MNDFEQTKDILDQINRAISGYDPVLKERARDLLLERAFASEEAPTRSARTAATPSGGRKRVGKTPVNGAATTPEAVSPRKTAAPRRAARGRATAGRRGPGPARRVRIDLSPLLERWAPARASERALLAAYAIDPSGRKQLTSQAINDLLKENGLKVSNITRAIETNLKAKPPGMEQVGKRGDTKQARKKYRLTEAGVEKVRGQIGA
jgi:hypothetical protein